MITRTYFVSYKTGSNLGMNQEGSITLTSKSWFPQPKKVYDKAFEFIESKNFSNGFCITQIYRIL